MPPAGEALIPEVHNEDGPATVLGNPPSLRGAGFNLRVLRNKELVSGGVRFRNSQLAVWLEHDGFLTASSRADSTFLGWAINDHMGTGPIWINPLTLVEFTFEFLRTLHAELIARAPGEWMLRVTCRRFASADIRLERGQLRRPPFFRDEFDDRVTEDSWHSTFATTGDPGRDAFAVLTRVYGLFGLGEDAIPYTDGKSISGEAIIESGRQPM